MKKYNVLNLNTARNALRYVVKAFSVKEIYIPYYICPAVRTALRKENCKIKYYHVNLNFEPQCEFPQDAYILYPNYFGVCEKTVDKLCKKYPNVIIDNAHALFSKPKGIASFYSLRKFFPQLLDGAILYTSKISDIELEKDDYSYTLRDLSFEELCKNENRLDSEDIKIMSDCTQNYWQKVDIETHKKIFQGKFLYWQSKLAVKNKFKLNLPQSAIPYKYPYLAVSESVADDFVSKLKHEKIVIYRYWNNLPDSYQEKDFYTKLVAI